MSVDPRLLEILVCPLCKGKLLYRKQAAELVCKADRLGYPVKDFSMSLVGEEVHRMTDARERRPLKAFAGQKVHGAAGIGDPNRFFVHLGRAGVKVIPHPFPDHHPFSPRDLEFGDGLPVILTEKDAVKLRSVARPDWWVLPVSARLDPGFGAWLVRKLDECRRSKAA